MADLVDEVPDVRADAALAVPEPLLVLPHPAHRLAVRVRASYPSFPCADVGGPFRSALTDIEVTDDRSDDEDEGDDDEDEKDKDD